MPDNRSATADHKSEGQALPSADASTQDPPYFFLAHGERLSHLESTRNKTQFTIDASVNAFPSPPQAFCVLPLMSPQRRYLHYEFAFLSRQALHVRFGLTNTPKEQEHSTDDLSFLPSHVRKWLFVDYFPASRDNNDEQGEQEEDPLTCGLELRNGDFNAWVDPRLRGGMEYQYVKNPDGRMGFQGFYNYSANDGSQVVSNAETESLSDEEIEDQRVFRVPLLKQNTDGPFTSSTMPAGVGGIDEDPMCLDLSEMRTGENVHVAFTDNANHARQNEEIPDDKSDVDTENQTKLAGKSGDPDLLLIWTDRDWGCLVNEPLPCGVDRLQRMDGTQILLSISTKGPQMEYIIVA